MHPPALRHQFRQGQHEGAFAHARWGYGEVGGCPAAVAIQQEVQIQRARCVAVGACGPAACSIRCRRAAVGQGGQGGVQLGHGIEVIGPAGIDGRVAIEWMTPRSTRVPGKAAMVCTCLAQAARASPRLAPSRPIQALTPGLSPCLPPPPPAPACGDDGGALDAAFGGHQRHQRRPRRPGFGRRARGSARPLRGTRRTTGWLRLARALLPRAPARSCPRRSSSASENRCHHSARLPRPRRHRRATQEVEARAKRGYGQSC